MRLTTVYSVFLLQFLPSPTLLYNNNLLAHWKSSYQIKVSTSFEVVGPRSDSCMLSRDKIIVTSTY